MALRDKIFYEKNKVRIREVQDKYRLKYKVRRIAQAHIQNALKTGKIKKKPCKYCGNPKSEAHHQDYSKTLEVLWLCRKHHRRMHTYNKFIFNKSVVQLAIGITGITRNAFANIIGTSKENMHEVDNGTVEIPSKRTIKKIAAFLNLRESDLYVKNPISFKKYILLDPLKRKRLLREEYRTTLTKLTGVE